MRLATGEAGINYRNRTDVLLAMLAPGHPGGGRLHQIQDRLGAGGSGAGRKLKGGEARALVVNSGNANAFTGKAGQDGRARDRRSGRRRGRAAGVRRFSWPRPGVIGEPLPTEKITRVLGQVAEDASAAGWRAAAEAIMTTDTYPKLATATAMIDGVKVTLNGIAKGSGMIAPDMATMLAFVFTDASLPAAVLQECLNAGVGPSFNSITVDSDTSTSDTLLLFATGKGAKHGADDQSLGQEAHRFPQQPGCAAARSGAAVVKDGEGAQKLIRIDVAARRSNEAAKRIGAVDRQFAAGQDRHRRQRRQLGPGGDGGGQGRRGGRPRQAQNLLRRPGGGRKGLPARPNITKPPRPRRCRGARWRSPSIWGSAKASPGFGPAT